MNSEQPEDRLFGQIAEMADRGDAALPPAPARLKARIYSRLVRRQQESGPLATLAVSKTAGRSLCVFEQAWTLLPEGEKLNRLNLCRVCHARMLAEKMKKAPIYWAGCPYVDFQKG